MNDLGNAIKNAAATILERLVTFIPSVLGAVALLFAGWVLARLLRAVTARGALLVDALIARALAPRTAEKLRMGRSAVVLGVALFAADLVLEQRKRRALARQPVRR